MAFKQFSDVRETSLTGGTGNQVLAGALDGSYSAFGSAGRYADTDTFFYCAKQGTAREIGLGTYNASANSISRTQVYKSTNSNALVGFAAGQAVDIFVTEIAPNDLDAAGLALLMGLLGVVRVVRVQKFSASGTYTPHPNMVAFFARAVGGGGGSGGVVGIAGSLRAGGAGASGSYSELSGTAADIGASKAVTIGAAGSAGTSSAGGGSGGTSSLGSICTAPGGGGGTHYNGSTGFGAPSTPGTTGAGDYVARGNPGAAGFDIATSLSGAISTPAGANSLLGAGAIPIQAGNTTATPGGAAIGPGGGASAGLANNTTSTVAGAAGAAGYVIIIEFCTK